MDLETATWLVSPEASSALDAARAEREPDSLGAATRLRRELPPDLAAAVLDQAVLQRRGLRKTAGRLRFLTSIGLEQATRWDVATWRAARLAESGVRAVVDLGSGLGLDAVAMLAAGIRVVAVEREPVVATLARANLGTEVLVGEAEALAPSLLTDPEVGVFCDPARRTAKGRTWDVADLSPSWDFVMQMVDGSRTACLKLGPGVPHRVLPGDVEVTWVSHRGDAVEATIWAGPGATPGRRAAVLLPDAAEIEATPWPPPVGEIGQWLVEPDPAVIRAGAVTTLAERHGLSAVAEQIAYLTGGAKPQIAPYGTVFEVLEVLPYDVKTLRAWVREHRVGVLEIKKRGVDLDPATLRKQLKPAGAAMATLVVTPTPAGVRVLIVRRA